MKPNIWGPNAWDFLHNVTLGYSENPSDKEKEAMYNFFNNVGLVLPCDKCKIYYYEHLKIYPYHTNFLNICSVRPPQKFNFPHEKQILKENLNLRVAKVDACDY